jgi:hypothetical protein
MQDLKAASDECESTIKAETGGSARDILSEWAKNLFIKQKERGYGVGQAQSLGKCRLVGQAEITA